MTYESPGYKSFRVLNATLMIAVIAVTLYPFLYVLFASLSDPALLMKYDRILLKPAGFSFKAYYHVFQNPMILLGYKNTFFVLVAGITVNMLITTLASYVLSRKSFPGRNLMMFFTVFTMFFSGGMIPTYLAVREYGLYNSLWALIFPTALSTYNMIIMRTSFAAVPISLEESAKLDGAGHFTILCRIILPLSKPVIAVIGLYYVVAHWNSWFNAMLYLQDRNKFPLQLVLREILIQGDTSTMTQNMGDLENTLISETVKHATSIVSTVPILIVYPFIQKYFVKGVMVGAIKG